MKREVNELLMKVESCIENEEQIMFCMEVGKSYITDVVTPEKAIITENKVYIEGGWLTLDIEGYYDIYYDNENNQHIIKQENIIYYIGY